MSHIDIDLDEELESAFADVAQGETTTLSNVVLLVTSKTPEKLRASIVSIDYAGWTYEE